eukprot:6590232-Pyramimonas_sp.AAC.1
MALSWLAKKQKRRHSASLGQTDFECASTARTASKIIGVSGQAVDTFTSPNPTWQSLGATRQR